jgi:hypothetical protein
MQCLRYSNPIVADLDGDGKLEILVGTSVGFIYVVNSDGRVRKGFPLQMGEIQAPITVRTVPSQSSSSALSLLL